MLLSISLVTRWQPLDRVGRELCGRRKRQGVNVGRCLQGLLPRHDGMRVVKQIDGLGEAKVTKNTIPSLLNVSMLYDRFN